VLLHRAYCASARWKTGPGAALVRSVAQSVSSGTERSGWDLCSGWGVHPILRGSVVSDAVADRR
jgi:hypothetical protein